MRYWPLLLLLVGCTGEEESSALPAEWKHPWDSFAIGTWVTYREVSMTTSDTIDSTEEWLLDRRNEDGHPVILITLTMKGKTHAPYENTVSLWDPKSGEPAGEEEVTIEGKKYACRILRNGQEKRWWCDEIPGWPVKEELRDRNANLLSDSRLVQLRSPIKVGDREIVCQVFEEREYGDATRRARVWKSQEVPGHIVRSDGDHSAKLVTGYGTPNN